MTRPSKLFIILWPYYMAMNFFMFRPEHLLVLNLKVLESMRKLCNFLQVPYTAHLIAHADRSGQLFCCSLRLTPYLAR